MFNYENMAEQQIFMVIFKQTQITEAIIHTLGCNKERENKTKSI